MQYENIYGFKLNSNPLIGSTTLQLQKNQWQDMQLLLCLMANAAIWFAILMITTGLSDFH
jgi:hypothetical protein